MAELIKKQFKCIGALDECMSGARETKDEFDELDIKLKIESDDFIETFFDIAQIEDDELRTKNIIGFAWNLIRDYKKDDSLANLPLFLDNLADLVRGRKGV